MSSLKNDRFIKALYQSLVRTYSNSILDYRGDEMEVLPVEDDLSEGKPTLPLIHVLQTGTEAERTLIRDAVCNKDASQIGEVIAAVRRCGSLDYARAEARRYQGMALDALATLPANSSRDAMQMVAELALSRDH